MKHRLQSFIVKFLAAAVLLGVTVGLAQAADWPRQVVTDTGLVIQVHEPVIESGGADAIEMRSAVMVSTQDAGDPVFGAVWLNLSTQPQEGSAAVVPTGVRITEFRFPDQDETWVPPILAAIEQDAMSWDLGVTHDELASMTAAGTGGQAATLANDPPRIMLAQEPSLLVLVDGEPILEPAGEPSLQKVVNTPFFMAFDKDNDVYFLRGGSFWYQADGLQGPWSPVDAVPEAISDMEEEKTSEPGTEEEPREIPETPPAILVSTEPAELIQTQGPPEFVAVEGTSLLYVKNSPDEIVLDIESQCYFVLVSGRWFKNRYLRPEGWEFVEPDQVPESFSMIPETSEVAYVRTSVPGTPEAKQSLLATQIPETAVVERSATLDVGYDGDPVFEPIEGTSLSYAVNTDKQIIKSSGSYYCCDRGVWYRSEVPEGPWSVADAVPDEVYEIPSESPVYNVSYVYVYHSTPEAVYVASYPGYSGTYVHRGVVVYGTGYHYRPWHWHHYYPRPWTYGFGAVYHPFYGWSFGFASGFGGPRLWFGLAGRPYHPWYWGPPGVHPVLWFNPHRPPGWHPGHRPPGWHPGQRPPGWHPGLRPPVPVPFKPGVYGHRPHVVKGPAPLPPAAYRGLSGRPGRPPGVSPGGGGPPAVQPVPYKAGPPAGPMNRPYQGQAPAGAPTYQPGKPPQPKAPVIGQPGSPPPQSGQVRSPGGQPGPPPLPGQAGFSGGQAGPPPNPPQGGPPVQKKALWPSQPGTPGGPGTPFQGGMPPGGGPPVKRGLPPMGPKVP